MGFITEMKALKDTIFVLSTYTASADGYTRSQHPPAADAGVLSFFLEN